jgi:hypothetical protein
MKTTIRTLLAITSVAFAAQAMAEVTFYENENFQGRSHTTQTRMENAQRGGFSDLISSVIVTASAGKPATTSVSAAVAWCCAPASTRRCRRWA